MSLHPHSNPTPTPSTNSINKVYNYEIVTTPEHTQKLELDPENLAGGSVLYQLSSGSLPGGLGVNGDFITGLISNLGTYQFTIVGTEGDVTLTSIYKIIVIPPTNQPKFTGITFNGQWMETTVVKAPEEDEPWVLDLMHLSANVGESITISPTWDFKKSEPILPVFTFVEGDTDEGISFSVPPGLTLDRYTGEITGVPTEVGTYFFVLSVKDWRGRGYLYFHLLVR